MLEVGSWTEDVGRLRETLDGLRAALARPVGALASDTVGHDKAAILATLNLLFEKLDATNLAARFAVAEFVQEFRPESQLESLRVLLAELQASWRDRVARILGSDKLAVVDRLLRSPSPDVLRILGREDHENSHSDLIAWLLTPRRAPTIAAPALRQLVSRLEGAEDWNQRISAALGLDLISVRREMLMARELANADDLCRVDIVVSGPGFVLAIENKVWSSEHSDQTCTYWEWLEPMRCLRGGLFLSPSGMPAISSSFTAVSYLDLVSALLEGPLLESMTSGEEIVLASYLKTLARSVLPAEMRAVVESARKQEAK